MTQFDDDKDAAWSERVAALTDTIATLRAQLDATLRDRAMIMAERDRTFALMLDRADRADRAEAELAAARAAQGKLRDALLKMNKAAGEVARMGAVTGPQWTRLNIALLNGRAALDMGDTK
jgi:hypothetical protein